MNINQFSRIKRTSCTGGSRHFFINSNGDTSRCASFFYNNSIIDGNITDPSFRERIREGKRRTTPCEYGSCISECDGHHTVQIIQNGDELITHKGSSIMKHGMIEKDFCVIQWSFTSHCNYDCPYCCASISMNTYKGKDLNRDQWMDTAIFFTNVFSTGHVAMLGGEPMIHAGFPEVCGYMADSGWKIDVFTNLSLRSKIEDLVKHIDASRRSNVFFIISLHIAQRKFDIEKMIENCKFLRDEGFLYGFGFVETPENVRLSKETKVLERLGKETNPCWISSSRDVTK